MTSPSSHSTGYPTTTTDSNQSRAHPCTEQNFTLAHKGTFHKMSPKHLDRYVQEFAARHNLRDEDTIDIMAAVITGMNGKRLRYVDLIADNGLDSGARTG